MDGNTLQQLRDALLSKRNRIDGSIVKDRDVTTDLNDHQAEIGDIAQALEQIDRDQSLKEVERRELHAIERALSKIATGHFGMCEDCDEEIPSRRLQIVPEARLCARCQAVEERQLSRMRVAAVGGR